RARRAGERPRRVGPGAGAEPARRPAAAPPAHLPVHRSRSRGREAHRGSGGGHVPWQNRGARARTHPVRRPPPSLHHVAALRRAGAGPQGAAPAHRAGGRRAVPCAPAARLPFPPTEPAPQEGRALPHGAAGIARGRTGPARGLPALLRGTAAIGADVRQAPHLIVWAVLAGCLWAVANTLTIFAIRDIGLSIAFPLWNANSLLGILWGAVFFNELHGAGWGRRLGVLGGAVLMFAGATLLAVASAAGEI